MGKGSLWPMASNSSTSETQPVVISDVPGESGEGDIDFGATIEAWSIVTANNWEWQSLDWYIFTLGGPDLPSVVVSKMAARIGLSWDVNANP